MAKFIIEGQHKLSGEITANGNKNAVLPILAATLLTDQTCIIRNVPKIRDVEYMAQLLKHIGANVSWQNDTTLAISAKTIKLSKLPEEDIKKIRASILLMGAMLSRLHEVTIPHPGGDIIGRRSVDTHIDAFRQMGFVTVKHDDIYEVKEKKFRPTTVLLDEISVTGTENALLAAAGHVGETVIKHAASEPHVQELCKVLHKMGVSISGIGTNVITLVGKKNLQGFDHAIGPDHIEVGTWAVLSGVTCSPLTIRNVNPASLEMILLVLRRFGLAMGLQRDNGYHKPHIDYEPHILTITPGRLTNLPKIDAYPWPGLPTDLISVLIVLATQSHGVTLVRDWMFEGRMFFTDKLLAMGANIILCDPHRVVVSGPTPLYGKKLDSPDLRAGMSLVLAALCANGKSVISNIEQVERGYAFTADRLNLLGAKIVREED